MPTIESMMQTLSCWVCGEHVGDDEYDDDAGQCKEREKRNPMPTCMRRSFTWPVIFR